MFDANKIGINCRGGDPVLLPDTTFLKYAVPVKPDPHPSAI